MKPHNDRSRHGYEAPSFTIRPCPNCGATQRGASSGPRPNTIHCTCGTCRHEWIQDSDQLIAATLSTIGSAA